MRGSARCGANGAHSPSRRHRALLTAASSFMRPLFEPALVNDDFGDPGLFIDCRDERRALLFDLGDLTPLPPRKLLRLSDVFVSHAHIDHFVGFDRWLRVVLGRKERVRLYGGPGCVAQVEHKLASYTWNVVHRYEVPLTIEAHELHASGGGRRATFRSRRRFAREDDEPWTPAGDVLLAEDRFRVRATVLDHDVPCLAFAFEEAVHVSVWKNRLAALGLPTGPWLREAKRLLLAGAGDDAPVEIHWRDHDGAHRLLRPLGELRHAFEFVPGRRFGYVTDLRYTEPNFRVLEALLAGVDVLFIEAVFLDAEAEQAARKNHLTAAQAGRIARRLAARAVVPFHFSPRYEGRAQELRAEVEAAWRSTGA